MWSVPKPFYYLYYLYVPVVLKCGSLKLLETPRPVQVCNGNALILPP